MKERKLSLSIVLLLLIPISSYSAEKMRIAVMDLKAKGVSVGTANNVSELIRTELINVGKYIVIERSQMDSIMKEQGLQQTGCTDESCAVEIGKMLSAKKMLVGSVIKLGSKLIINGRVVDVEKGVGEFGQKESSKSEDDLDRAVTDFCKKLTARIFSGTAIVKPRKDDKPQPESISSNPYTIPAFGLGGLGLASLGGGIFFNLEIGSLNSDYDSLAVQYNAAGTQTEAVSLHQQMSSNRDDADTNALYRNIAYGVGGASLLVAGYFFYKYFTYQPQMLSSKGAKKNTEILPVMYSNFTALSGNTFNDRYFFGGGLMIRF